MRVTTLAVILGSVLSAASAFAGTDAGINCDSADWRCTDDCVCDPPMREEPCNSLPDGDLGVLYPTAADPVEVICPTVIMQGAHDPEDISDLFYRVEVAGGADSQFEVLLYDSGLVEAGPATTEKRIEPNVRYPAKLTAGLRYWLRVTDADSCSNPTNPEEYFLNPEPLLVSFEIDASADDNCGAGDSDADTDADSDADSDIDADSDGDGGGGGSACGGCTTQGRPDGVLATLAVLGLAASARRRRS